MIQQLSLACAFILLVSSGSVFGLGLGKLELGSALNQQFEAEIELTNVGQLTIDEVLPNLASQDDFARVGVERNDILTDLRFKVVANPQGKLVLKVTSTRPIIEPFLNFIVDSSGRVVVSCGNISFCWILPYSRRLALPPSNLLKSSEMMRSLPRVVTRHKVPLRETRRRLTAIRSTEPP
jgi:hypothetical protein